MAQLERGLCPDEADYIIPCKWDQEDISECVREDIEKLRDGDKLKDGIKELDLPGLDPLYIEEVIPNIPGMEMAGKDIKVTGASDFNLTKMYIDLDRKTIELRLHFPKIHVEGLGKVDVALMGLPIKGELIFNADAIKVEASGVLHFDMKERDGVEYMHFTKLNLDIIMKDYKMRLDGIKGNNNIISKAVNQVIHQNRVEMLRMTKPYLELIVSDIIVDMANNVVRDIPADDLFIDRTE